MKKLKIYLASGWFNSEQKKQMEEIYEVIKLGAEEGRWDYFAPFYDGITLQKDDPNLRRKMQTVWWLDIQQLQSSDLVVACTQDHDVGTIFECGYASAQGKIIFCYNSKPELGLNVMLSQEARAFVKTPHDLNKALLKFHQAFETGEKLENFRYNLWKGEPI